MFKVNNIDTRTLSMASSVTPCPRVSIVNIEHEIAAWEGLFFHKKFALKT